MGSDIGTGNSTLKSQGRCFHTYRGGIETEVYTLSEIDYSIIVYTTPSLIRTSHPKGENVKTVVVVEQSGSSF